MRQIISQVDHSIKATVQHRNHHGELFLTNLSYENTPAPHLTPVTGHKHSQTMTTLMHQSDILLVNTVLDCAVSLISFIMREWITQIRPTFLYARSGVVSVPSLAPEHRHGASRLHKGQSVTVYVD